MKKNVTPTSLGRKSARTARPLSTSAAVGFPIVGIGASAGGLEALEQFLNGIPADSGMAFVIVSHLDPTRKGIMAELLQRGTRLKVAQVKDHTPVQPNCVYVIPPNKDMSILHGNLHLFEPASARGLRLPIDYFLRSLAEDQRERSVAVILSGMGTDGTLGLKAIKELGGVVLIQEPASAKFDGMPRSAIDTGLADFIAPAEELPRKLAAYFQHAPLALHPQPVLENQTQTALDKIVILLRAHVGHDFSQYKKSTLYRRVERRMGIHQIDRIARYVRYLQENPQERELLFNEMLIGVTSFFRDPSAWEQLQTEALPALLAERPEGGQLRAWTPGCSTGEEAFSLAIAFRETLGRVQPKGRFTLQIFATDLDRAAIDRARQGSYPANIAADVSPERLRRFFAKEDDGSWRVAKEIREMVILAPQNLIMDPPFTKLDILICRNLLIYLSPELQKRLMPLFHYSLNPGGILFLGSSETTGGGRDLFTSLNGKWRIYRRRESITPAEPVDFPVSFFPARQGRAPESVAPKPVPNLQTLADELLLRTFAPAAVLVTSQGDILYINGRTGQYLEPAAGKANWNIHAMARDGLRYELGAALQQAGRQKGAVTRTGLQVQSNDQPQTVTVTVQRLEEPEAVRGMFMIVFTDEPAPPAKAAKTRSPGTPARTARAIELEREAQHLHAELQTTREEMQTSQEELRSANEELQSTNEELQSTNEELTTSKEEMQSLNEELQTVNAEMQAKVDELSRTNNDMKNLLNSTDIATVFLDNMLNVRRFTIHATKIFKLIPGDVGRPVTDITSDLDYPDLPEDVQEVLRTLIFKEKPVVARDGRWFMTRVMPYRTLENRIDGVVITFTDITAAKKLEEELRRTRDEMGTRVRELQESKTTDQHG